MTGMQAQMRMEWRIQRGRPFVLICLVASFLLAFGATVQNAYGQHGFSWVNGADAIATRALILSVLGLILAAGIVGEAMGRDRASGTEEIVLGTGASRVAFGLGRFVVTCGIVTLVASMYLPGMILGAMMPGIAADRLGPFVPGHYLKAFAYYILPNMLLVSALIYAVAARTRSQTAGFVVALGLIALYVTALMMLGRDAYRHDLFGIAALLDPYGNIASAEYAMTWTVAENNRQFRPLASFLLLNRAIWLVVAGALIAIGTYGVPLFVQDPSRRTLRGRTGGGLLSWQLPAFLDRALIRQTLWEVRALARQPGILLMLGFAAVSLWWSAVSTVTYTYSLPSTDLLIHNADFYFDKILVVLLVWYAGDIVWREQHCHVDEMVDALPGSTFDRLMSKTLALLVMVLGLWVVAIGVNVAYQVSQGFYDFEWGLYLTDTFVFKAPYYLWMAVLAVAMQAILRNRYLAMIAVLMVYLSRPLLDALGFYHPIYRFGEVSFLYYSLMDGYGHFWRAHLWFLAYWSFGAALVWLIGWGCFGRGTEPDPRRVLIRRRLSTGAGRGALAVVTSGFVLLASGIVYQSMIQHRWPLMDEGQYAADLERRFRADWAAVPQPKITGIKVAIEIFPEDRRIEVDGTLTLRNIGDDTVTELLVFFHPLLKTAKLSISDHATRATEPADLHVQRWHLNTPLAPGAELHVPFRTASWPDPGFAAHSEHDLVPDVHGVEVIGNGTSLLNLNLIPAFGYSERLEHKPTWLRRMYGLPEGWTPPPSALGHDVAHDTTHLAWVEHVDVTVGTSADQIPLHSGEMVEDLGVTDGRRHIRYAMHHPSRGWAEVMSGRYDVYRAQRAGLPAVELYHHPAHDYVLGPLSDHLLDAIAYFQARYGPAPFDTFRMAEASLHYTGLGVRGGMAYVSEVLGWKSDLRASGGEDLRHYAADFMGQAWWLDQIMPANLPGAKTVLTGMPYWTSALYQHQARGPALSRDMRLQDMQEMYRSRAGLSDTELPFDQAMKDSTMVRLKGALHVIYLAELVGQDRLEAAFARFLSNWKFQPAPYPTAADFAATLKAELPAKAHPQIDDFLSHVSNWTLSVREAKAWPLADGQWQLRAVVDAQKTRTVGMGTTTAPLNTPLPVAAFQGDGFTDSDVIAMQWQDLPSGQSVVEMTLPTAPTRFGIDPYLTLPDANPHDNMRDVTRLAAAPD